MHTRQPRGRGVFFLGGGVLKFYCIVSRKIRLGLIIEFTPSPKISMLGKLIIIDLHQLRHFIAVKIGIYLCVARYNFVHRTLLLLDIQVLYLHVHSESPVTYICLPYTYSNLKHKTRIPSKRITIVFTQPLRF